MKEFQAFERQAYKRIGHTGSGPSQSSIAAVTKQSLRGLGWRSTGQFSIRINRQWRICFEWPEDVAEPYNIEIADYH